jgi:hypothetical protein
MSFPVFPPEIVDIIISMMDALGLIMLSKTCKKYRSDYIVHLAHDAEIYVEHPKKPYYLMRRDCELVLLGPHAINEMHLTLSISHMLPQVTHSFTARMLRSILDEKLQFGYVPRHHYYGDGEHFMVWDSKHKKLKPMYIKHKWR